MCENDDMIYTDMNCFETKCQIREAQNCESHQEKKVDDYKLSTDAIFISIESQQDSTPIQMHLVIFLKKKLNFLSISIIMVIFCYY